MPYASCFFKQVYLKLYECIIYFFKFTSVCVVVCVFVRERENAGALIFLKIVVKR